MRVLKIMICADFWQISQIFKKSQGTSLKARDIIFWILALYIHIQAPVKTEFAKSIKMVDFKGGGMITPPRDELF